jgi:integrase
MARGRTIYVSNPKPHGKRWRVTVTERIEGGDGGDPTRDVRRRSFPTATAANAYRTKLLAEQGKEPVDVALDRYIKIVEARGGAKLTPKTIRYSISRLLALLPGTVDEVQPSRAERAYLELVPTCAVDTHQNSLRDTRAMWAALKLGAAWDEVVPVGRRKKGKPKLTIDESRRFLSACMADGRPGALAAALCLTLAIRAGEVVALTGRDVDDNGRVLWIHALGDSDGKTENASRGIEVPEVIRPALLARAAAVGRGRLFPWSRGWVGWQVIAMCDAAGVPRVCPHGLRGTHATIAASAGVTAHVVAATLGHAPDAGVTRDHYIAPGVEQSAAARLVGNRLGAGMVSSWSGAQTGRPTKRN